MGDRTGGRGVRTTSGERFRSAMAAPRPYDGFESCWSWVRGLPVHDRRLTAAAGVPVVLVHGLAVSHRYLMPFARALAARHRVHVIDLPRFGLSGEPGRVLDLPQLADVLGAWLDAVGLRRPVLGGNSFGCQVVVDLVAQRPAAAQALVLIGPTMTRTPARRCGRRCAGCATCGTRTRPRSR